MNVGTLTISLTARTAALLSSLSKVRVFESGVLASVQRMNRSIGVLGQSLSILSLPLVAIGALAVSQFAKFEFAMAKTVGLAGVASEQVQKWTADVLHLSKKTGESATDLAEALYFVSSSGIHGAKVLETLEVAAYGAMVGLGKTKDIANLLTSVMNAYGITNTDVAGTMDTLIAAVREGKAEADDMAKSLGMVVNVAAELGVSFANVASAVAATTRTGVSTNTSATQLRQFLFMFLKERPMVEAALESMGLSFEEVRKSLSDDLLKGLIKLRAVTSAYGDSALAKVIPNVRAFNEALSLSGVNVLETMKLFRAIQNPTNAFAHAVESVADTVQVRFKRAMATLNASLISFGASIADDVMPIVQKFTEVISKLLGWFTNLDSKTQSMIITITAISAVLGPLLLTLSSMVTIIFSILSVFSSWLVVIIAVVAAIAYMKKEFISFNKTVDEQGKEQESALSKWAKSVIKKFNVKGMEAKLSVDVALLEQARSKWNDFVTAFASQKEKLHLGELQTELNQLSQALIDLPRTAEAADLREDKYQEIIKHLKTMYDYRQKLLDTYGEDSGLNVGKFADYNEQIVKSLQVLASARVDAGLYEDAKDNAEEFNSFYTSFLNDLKTATGDAFSWIKKQLPDFNKLLSGGSGTGSPKLNIGSGNGFGSLKFLEYTGDVANKMRLINQLKDQGNLTEAFGMTGFMVGAAEMASFIGLGVHLEKINKEISKLIENKGDLKGYMDALPQGIKDLMDPATLVEINEIVALQAKAIADADAKLKLYTNSNLNFRTMGETVMDGVKEMIDAFAKLNTVMELNGGKKGTNVLEAQLQYWQSIQQAMETMMQDTKTKNGPLAIIDSGVIKTWQDAGVKIDEINTKLAKYGAIASGVVDITNSIGEAIGNAASGMENAWTGVVDALLAAAQQIIAAMLSVAVAALIADGATKGLLGLVLAAVGIAVLTAMWTSQKAKMSEAANLAQGGIVPGGYPNDTFRANLSSNEAVIPLERLPQLLGIGRSGKNQRVEFVIEGRVLKGILKDADMMYGIG